MKAIHFGAGNIGRGFIGQVLHHNNFDITFVDADQNIVSQLNKRNGYFIEYLNAERTRFFIGNVDAVNILLEKECVENRLCESDLVTTSVGVNNLKKVAPVIKNGLLKRSVMGKSVNLLANENAINASELLKTEIKKICTEFEWEKIRKITFFANTSIDRQSLSKVVDGEAVALVEPYFEWIINVSELAPDTAYKLSGVKFVKRLAPFIERKLFIVNAGHAAFAYIGASLGYKTVQEAISNPQINSLVKAFLTENVAYFVTVYSMDKEELVAFIDDTIKRHGNPMLSDPVERVGRDPIRKLNGSDRLVAPVSNLYKRNLKVEAGLKIIAAAYLYDNPDDAESAKLQSLIAETGIKNSIREISNLPEVLIDRVSEIYQKIKCNRQALFN